MIIARAPNGELIVESYEVINCAYPIAWEGTAAEPSMEYTGGDRRLFDDDARPIQVGGEDCYLDESGAVWGRSDLTFEDAPDEAD